MKLLFVCTGNICRSPMAERLSVVAGARHGHEVVAQSAGTLGLVNRPAERHAIAVLKERGVDLRDHICQPLTAEQIQWADHVLCMELAHGAHARALAPAHADRVRLLGPFAGVPEIPDPMGGWRWTFRSCRDQLELALDRFFVSLASDRSADR